MINIGPSKSVSDSLAFFIDAANPASYPGSGSSWSDLSPNRLLAGSYFDLYGAGIEYSTDFGGFVFFNNNVVGGVVAGPTGYAYSAVSPSLIAGTKLTIEMFFRSYPTGFDEQNIIQISSRYYFVMDGATTANPSLGFTTGQSNSFYFNYNDEGISPFYNWNHMVLVVNGDGTYASYYQNKIYFNGVQLTLLPQDGVYLTGGNGNISFNAGYEMSFGFRVNGVIHGTPTLVGNRLSKFDLGVLRIYKGELTQDQISQNFNSLRERYGI